MFCFIILGFDLVEAVSRQWQIDSAKGIITINRQGETAVVQGLSLESYDIIGASPLQRVKHKVTLMLGKSQGDSPRQLAFSNVEVQTIDVCVYSGWLVHRWVQHETARIVWYTYFLLACMYVGATVCGIRISLALLLLLNYQIDV